MGSKYPAKGPSPVQTKATLSSPLTQEKNAAQSLPIIRKYLPWQMRSLLIYLQAKKGREILVHDKPDRGADGVQGLRVSRIREASHKSLMEIRRWALSHRATFQFLSKSFVFTSLGVLFLKSIESWYKGMAEFEILLDRTDLAYQRYGSNLYSASSSLMSTLDHFNITDHRLASMHSKLSLAMDTPCFPRTMNEYICRTGQDVAALLFNVDAWVQVDIGRISSQDQTFLSSILSGILVLQARQADAYLRSTRLVLLSAVNTCEDLLVKWTGRAAMSSQTRRLPLPRAITKKIPLLGTASTRARQLHHPRQTQEAKHTDRYMKEWHPTSRAELGMEVSNNDSFVLDIMYDMNAREKVIFLEALQNELYGIVGQIQNHQEKLDYMTCPGETTSDCVLSNWISYASSLSAKGLRVMSMHNKGHRHVVDASGDSAFSGFGSRKKSSTASINLLLIGRKRDVMDRSVKNDFGLFQGDKHNQSEVFILNGKLQRQVDDTLINDAQSTTQKMKVLESIDEKGTPTKVVSPHEHSKNSSSNISFNSGECESRTTSSLQNLEQLRYFWREGTVIVHDLSNAPIEFRENLEKLKLQTRRKWRISKLLSAKNLLRSLIFGISSCVGVHLAQNGRKISASLSFVRDNMLNFFHRRIAAPVSSIANDVILNKRVSLTDKEALVDAKRSLNVMISDFLREFRPKLSIQERVRLASQMDMSPISEEYERELNRPIQNLLSGRIARLVLIQLQFVKKELLVSMQAIDELFNANQVNLQLLAVTPAIMSLILAQMIGKGTLNIIKTSSRGRIVESSKVVHANLRSCMRDIERLVAMSRGFTKASKKMSDVDKGRFLSLLYRIHNILVFNGSQFDSQSLKQFQEDLRDLLEPTLDASQRLVLVEGIMRYHPFLHNTRKSFL